MNLVLEVVGHNAQSLATGRRKVFGVGGGRIGRSPDCDWVLASLYISRHHATVCCIDGTFYIESTGENGVAINTPQATLPQLERRALKDGDRLFIDEYEIAVGVSTGASFTGAETHNSLFDDPLSDDLLDDDAGAPGAGVRGSSPRRDAAVADPLRTASSEELDPLRKLAVRASTGSVSVTAPRREASWNHTPSLADHFSPPPVPNALLIGEDWNQTQFTPSQQFAPPPAAVVTQPGIVTRRPSAHATQSFGVGDPYPVGAATQPPDPGAQPAQGTLTQPRIAVAQVAAGAPTQPKGFSAQPALSTVTQPRAPVQPAASPAPDPVPQEAFDLSTLLKNCGVDPATVSPETSAVLGVVMRSLVQGLIDVLRARAEFRNQFRLPVTRVRSVENNPLKFSINAEDALGTLLGRRNPGFMPPAEAFEDAFDDVRFHQLAMLAGMRAGFENVMSRFDPKELRERFDRQLKQGGFLSVAGKLRYWDLYTDVFEELTADPDTAFQRLFGDEFAESYEKQLEALKRTRGKPRQ